jgi:enoyl-[acyl-carrier protein] reductase I
VHAGAGANRKQELTTVGFLNFEGKTFAIFGVANKKSVAWHIAQVIEQEGGRVVHGVRDEQLRSKLLEWQPGADVVLCDVEHQEQIDAAAAEIGSRHPVLHGLVHSLAFASYPEGFKPFHETRRQDFLQAVDISCFSFIALANAFKGLLAPDASVVTISISTTRMASENYGYMAPVKAALDSSLAFLTKSFSAFSRVRFNAVAPSLLKTSASAGIPNYVDSYLFAEKVIPRKKAVQTTEVANVAAFLLSERASGITAQSLVIDAGMSINYFDRDLVERAMRP